MIAPVENATRETPRTMSQSKEEEPVTLAIVEDDPRIRQSLVTILSREDSIKCVAAFASGEEALKHLPELRPKVVLMDINLGGMDGVECVRRIAKLNHKMQILMLTVHEDTDAIFQSLAAGASGYLLKPPRAAELVAAVHDVTAGGAPMTSSIARKVVQSFKQAPPAREVENLSAREVEVLELLVKGYAYKEVAAELNISYSTVHTHIERIYEKLHVHSRSHAIAKYLGA
jgi:DNA-binding NarL/FixJ family response regulator